jgi:hypothetical protein
MSTETATAGAPTPSIAQQQREQRPFFDESRMQPPTYKYVCWVDVMGSQSIMLRSLSIASNFLMKLHVAALIESARARSRGFPVELYPVIDGVYVCSQSQNTLLRFLNGVHRRLAITFTLEGNPFHKFMIRSGLAYGPVVRGRDALECADILGRNPDHSKQILLGSPLTQAYLIERKAPPFGVALHESVRTFSPFGETVMFGTYWKWWKSHCQAGDDTLALELADSLKKHYDWCLKHTVALSYEKVDIDKHKLLAEEYFSD